MTRRWAIAALAGLCLLLAETATSRAAPATSPAAEPETHRPADEPSGKTDRKPAFGRPDSDFGRVVAQSLGAVFVILVLGVVAILVIKRVLPRIGVTQGRRIHVLETVYLGPRRSLHMVRIGERILLVGATNEGLGLLSDLTGFVSLDGTEGPAGGGKRLRFTVPGAEPPEEQEKP